MKRAAVALTLLLSATASEAARVTVGTAGGSPGGTAAVPITFASEGASVAALSVDLLFGSSLQYQSVAVSAAAAAAGKVATVNSITGGGRLIIYGLNQSLIPDGPVATVTFSIGAGTANGTVAITAANAEASNPTGTVSALPATSGSVVVGGSSTTASTFVLPSSAHASGANGAFYTTDLTVANTGTSDGTYSVKFLGHDADGRGGAEYTFTIGAGKTTVIADVLGSLFGVTSGYGAIQVKGSVAALAVSGQTSTPAPACVGGTFGQSVPAASGASVIGASARSILGIREDTLFRTNLILANWGETQVDLDATLVLPGGSSGGTKRYTLQPLGMTQVTKVARDLGYGADVSGARLVLAAATSGGSFAAYASVIDNTTNDPRTLLPQ